MTPPPEMACRHCHQPLNTIGDPTNPTYLHPAHKGPADHTPIPVPVTDLDTLAYVCDFCGDPHPLWSLRGGTITTITRAHRDPYIQDYGHRWSACAACEADADTGRIDAIIDRAAHAMKLPSDGRQQLATLHRAFFADRQPGRQLLTTTTWPPSTLTAHDLPRIRDRLTRLLHTPDLLPDHLRTDDTATVADQLDHAALYWIDPDFTDLAEHATTQLPDSPLSPDDLPTTCGLAIWARPITEHHIHAATWTIHNGLILTAYRSIGTGLNPALLQRSREHVGWLVPIRTLHLQPGQHVPAGSPTAPLVATCLLIAQQLAHTDTVEPDRAIRRRYARAHRQPPEIRLVRIKARTTSRNPTTGGQRTPLHHREWVGGHWKQQAHGPGRTQRRLIYVAPYLRGPDDQPIRTSTTVRVLGTPRPKPTNNP